MCDDGDYDYVHLRTLEMRSRLEHTCDSCEVKWPAGVVMQHSSHAGEGSISHWKMCPVCAFATDFEHEDSVVHFCTGEPAHEWRGAITDAKVDDEDFEFDRTEPWDFYRYLVACMVAGVKPDVEYCTQIRSRCHDLPPYTIIPKNYATAKCWTTKRGPSVNPGWKPPTSWRIPELPVAVPA